MATPEWPSTLPQSPLLEGFSSVPQDSVLRSDMDALTKQRNRFTAVVYDVEESYLLTPAQYTTFRNFYHSTLGNGAEDFLKPNPESGLTELYRFADVYEAIFNGLQYRVALTMERLP